MLESIQNYLKFVVDNWTYIFTIICLIFLIYMRIRAFFKKSTEERVAAAKAQIRQVVLKWVTEAEMDYAEWTQAGSIKRSQVIQKIYEDYPILNKIADQDTVVAFIDTAINEALKTMREIVDKNTAPETPAE